MVRAQHRPSRMWAVLLIVWAAHTFACPAAATDSALWERLTSSAVTPHDDWVVNAICAARAAGRLTQSQKRSRGLPLQPFTIPDDVVVALHDDHCSLPQVCVFVCIALLGAGCTALPGRDGGMGNMPFHGCRLQIHLSTLFPTGRHVAGWKRLSAWAFTSHQCSTGCSSTAGSTSTAGPGTAGVSLLASTRPPCKGDAS
jgi:hypothetical protein